LEWHSQKSCEVDMPSEYLKICVDNYFHDTALF
jgi:hypothetical protein